jgi:hypothetical protein
LVFSIIIEIGFTHSGLWKANCMGNWSIFSRLGCQGMGLWGYWSQISYGISWYKFFLSKI